MGDKTKTEKEEKKGPSRKELKVTLETSKTALKDFMKKNKLKEDSEPKDSAIAKQLKALRTTVKENKVALKAAKGSSGGSGRNTQYDYPAEMTDAKERKRFRAKTRAEKKRAEKGEVKKEKKAEKSESSEKKSEKKSDKKKSSKED